MTSPPLKVFQDINLGTIREWVSSRKQEDLHLEFKTLAGRGEFDRSDRKNLAIAISGFANSDGGILVWGVDSRKDEDGVDAATELVPIQSLPAVLSKVQSLSGQVTNPIVEGIIHKPIADTGDEGFLITFVPPSDCGPHMAGVREHRYYKRSGDSFYKMEHFDVADMFGRRARPILDLDVVPRVGARGTKLANRWVTVEIFLGLINEGRGIAKHPYLKLKVPPPYKFARYGLDGNGRTGLPESPTSHRETDWRIFAGGVNDVVHAGSIVHITYLEIQVEAATTNLPDLTISYDLACEGVSVQRNTKTVEGRRLFRLARDVLSSTSF